MSSLALLPTGASGVVTTLPETRGVARRLISLGLAPGAEVHMLQNRGRGAVILEVHGARLALGRGQAERVDIRAMTPEAQSSQQRN
jgi:Fe2+ transport system protein FeoA